MRSRRTRLVQRALLALLVVVSAAVVWGLRRPQGSGPSAVTRPPVTPGGGSTAKDVVFLRFREGAQQIEVKARAQAGQEGGSTRLLGAEVTFPYVAEGKTQSATIRAEECLYQPQPLRVSFRGKVHLRTEDGFELETEQLDYAAEDATTRSDVDVSFRQGSTSGSGRGLLYDAKAGELQLQQNVRLRIEQEGQVPADVEAASLRVLRPEQRSYLEGGVVVRQGARELRCATLQLNLSGDLRRIERASAIEDAELRISGASVPGTPTGSGSAGEKRLHGRKLTFSFREKGALDEVTAVNPASLEILPGPGQARERRQVDSDLIRFRFDEQGRLIQLEAQGGGPEARRTVMSAEPIGVKGAPARRVASLNAIIDVVPETGQLSGASFEGDVQFSDGARQAFAQRAEYAEATGLLKLAGEPRLRDPAQGSELVARRIELGTRSHSVVADEEVRHTLTRSARGSRPASPGGEEPTVFLCRHFEYDQTAKTGRYSDNALMRSGHDEIRAPLIVVEEPAEGRRRLSASGGVGSLLHPRPEKGKSREPQPIETRSRELVYEESERRVVYTGEVELRQGDMLTKSPTATVFLTGEGTTVERAVAGEPVEVRQGTRRATGERGTYTAKDETLVLVGEKVVLLEAERRIEGRVLTFQSGSDRIRVDGREEVRSEAVLKRKDHPRP